MMGFVARTLGLAALTVMAASAPVLAQTTQAPQAAPASPARIDVRASGGFLIASMVYTSCASQEEAEQLACRVYMQGVADSMIMHKDNGWAPFVLCNAGDLRADQLAQIFVNFVQRHPQVGEWTGAAAVYNALAERYPCPPAQ